MVLFKDAQTYFEQSKLLIQARPSTTRISTKYTVPKPRPPTKKSRPRKDGTGTQPAAANDSTTTAVSTPAAPKATLTLKTYDPVSGTCLKYATDKQAEVGRLIAGLGRLARDSAALPEKPEGEAAAASGGDGLSTPMEVDSVPATTAAAAGAQAQQQQQSKSGGQAGGGGGGGGKKKGKKGRK